MLQAAKLATADHYWPAVVSTEFQEQSFWNRNALAGERLDDLSGRSLRVTPMSNQRLSHERSTQPRRTRHLQGQTQHAQNNAQLVSGVAHDSLGQTAASLGIQQQSTYATAPFSQHASANVQWSNPQAATYFPNDNDQLGIHNQAENWQRSALAGTQQYSVTGLRRSSRLPLDSTPDIQISTTFHDPTTSVPQAATSQYGHFLAVNTPFVTYPNMADQTPVSPVSHHSNHSRTVTPLPEHSRKRSYSEVSQDALRSPMQDSTSPGGYALDEQHPARKSRTVKRGDAPMNADHKYICNISEECIGLTFDRKCEWGKHQDKHDRPYTCSDPGCAKLQGFTYSGGLLRHEREVHGKHGGPKALLMCPILNCKRHTEKGFTRKENLQEHIRRVHAEGDQSAEPVSAIESLDPSSAMSTGPSADELYAAAALNGNKRKRSFVQDETTGGEVDALRAEVRRLRTENEAKSAVIHRLEEDARAQSARLTALEGALHQQRMPVQQPMH